MVLVADELIAGIDEFSFNFMYVHYIFLEGCTVHVDCTHMYSSRTVHVLLVSCIKTGFLIDGVAILDTDLLLLLSGVFFPLF